ncbi:MAG TPA: hypothetical protein VGS62_11765, partial [Streptosporangiaceae bacterium]|nr:hypothetical protein [Streptosporangiaceae bacterium]
AKLYAGHATPDGRATTEIDATRYLPAKLAAMRAHATQISVDGQFFALSDRVPRLALGREFYTLLATASAADGAAGTPYPRPAREDDLFTGTG